MSIKTKALQIYHQPHATIIELAISGKLCQEDYNGINAAFENVLEIPKEIRILILLEDFEGWTPAAFWEDIKFDAKHFDDVARIAIVGESFWEKAVTVLFKPFTKADMRYFDRADEAPAQDWILGA